MRIARKNTTIPAPIRAAVRRAASEAPDTHEAAYQVDAVARRHGWRADVDGYGALILHDDKGRPVRW